MHPTDLIAEMRGCIVDRLKAVEDAIDRGDLDSARRILHAERAYLKEARRIDERLYLRVLRAAADAKY